MSKFRNVRTPCRAGGMHQSKLEARRCDDLHLMQAAGEIFGLRAHPQPRYELRAYGHPVGTFVADFEYRDATRTVTEDCKGFMDPRSPTTRLYRLKAALFAVQYGRVVVEVTK